MLTNNKDLLILKRLNTKAKVLVIILLACAFSIGLGIPLLFGNIKSTQNSSTLSPTKTPAPVSLNLIASSKSANIGKPFYVNIDISSPEQEVDATDATIYFDPTVLKVVKITNGDFFQTVPVKRIQKNYVKISATATLKNDKIVFPKGGGTIATITFEPLKQSKNTLIYFDPDNTIVASQGQNVTGILTDLSLPVK